MTTRMTTNGGRKISWIIPKRAGQAICGDYENNSATADFNVLPPDGGACMADPIVAWSVAWVMEKHREALDNLARSLSYARGDWE